MPEDLSSRTMASTAGRCRVSFGEKDLTCGLALMFTSDGDTQTLPAETT
jgi:hypothetical protein